MRVRVIQWGPQLQFHPCPYPNPRSDLSPDLLAQPTWSLTPATVQAIPSTLNAHPHSLHTAKSGLLPLPRLDEETQAE